MQTSYVRQLLQHSGRELGRKRLTAVNHGLKLHQPTVKDELAPVHKRKPGERSHAARRKQRRFEVLEAREFCVASATDPWRKCRHAHGEAVADAVLVTFVEHLRKRREEKRRGGAKAGQSRFHTYQPAHRQLGDTPRRGPSARKCATGKREGSCHGTPPPWSRKPP